MDFFPTYLVVCYVFFFFSRGLIGLSRLARLGMNFMSWCIEPIRERSCFSVLGGFKFIMESVFFTVGEFPTGLFCSLTTLLRVWQIRIFLIWWLGFLCRVWIGLCICRVHGRGWSLLLWLVCHLKSWICCRCFRAFCPRFFGMWQAYRLDRRIRLWTDMCQLICPRVCWSCNVFWFRGVVGFGCMYILGLLSKVGNCLVCSYCLRCI